MAYGRRKKVGPRTRGPIVWKDRNGSKPAPFARPMASFDSTANDGAGEFDQWFVNGALWTTKCAMEKTPNAAGIIPYVDVCYVWPGGPAAPIPAGSIALYAGGVHTDERDRRGRDMRVWRHTFIINGARYIVVQVKKLMEPVK